MLDEILLTISENKGVILAAIVSPIAAGLLALLWKAMKAAVSMRRVHVVESSIDERIENIDEIQRIFPPEERDPVGFLHDVIRTNDKTFASTDSFVLLLCYERHGYIHGYLSAEYVPSSKTIFLWYLVDLSAVNERTIRWGDVDTSDPERQIERRHALELVRDLKKRQYDKKVSIALIRKLSRLCDRLGGPWQHVIAEVDTAHKKEARAKLVKFQRFGREIVAPPRWLVKIMDILHLPKGLRAFLRVPMREPDRVFIVDTPFKMPLHDPSHLADGSDVSAHESEGWLVYARRPRKKGGGKGPARTLPRADVITLLDALELSYRRDEGDAYNAYIKRFYDGLRASAPETATLKVRD